jgi:integrase/recombinase XerD
MIEDMNARKLCAGTQRGHIHACKRFAAFLKRSPDSATLDDIRRFQLHLADTGVSRCTRNCIMTGLRFLFRVTLRRLDLAEEIYHIREPQKLPLVMSVDEMKRLLAVADNLKTRVLLSLGYGCGLRASEIVRLKVKHIETEQKIIRIEQSKGRKDRYVKLPDEMRGLPSTITIEHPDQKPRDAILCPEQVGKTESCSTCGLCWHTKRRIAFIQH